MFTVTDRTVLRDRIVQRALDDDRYAAAALLGSAARSAEDVWSDIDLAIRLRPTTDADEALADWSDWLTSRIDVCDQLDVHASGAIYRVFLCRDSLQIDLSLWPWETFRATNGEPMTLIFGEALEADAPPGRGWRHSARMGWLYALHARSAIHRGRALQADLMLSNWRECVLELACLRLGRNPNHAREAHLLPAELQQTVERARPGRLTKANLMAALGGTAKLYLDEVARHDPSYSSQLRDAIDEIAHQPG